MCNLINLYHFVGREIRIITIMCNLINLICIICRKEIRITTIICLFCFLVSLTDHIDETLINFSKFKIESLSIKILTKVFKLSSRRYKKFSHL